MGVQKMKKILVIPMILLIGLFTACSNNHDELYEAIEEQAALIDELQRDLSEQRALQQEYLSIITQLQAEINTQTENERNRLQFGLTENEIRESFFQNAEALVRSAVGEVYHSSPLREEDVILLIGDFNVIVKLSKYWNNTVIFLSYEKDWSTGKIINWKVTAYGSLRYYAPFADFTTYIISPREPTKVRHLTDLETVTLPFSWGLGLERTEEIIPGENLWEEAIRLT